MRGEAADRVPTLGATWLDAVRWRGAASEDAGLAQAYRLGSPAPVDRTTSDPDADVPASTNSLITGSG